MAFEQVAALAIGPAGSVAVLLLGFYAVYQIMVKHVLPRWDAQTEQQREELRKAWEQHQQDRETFQGAVLSISESHRDAHVKLDGILTAIQESSRENRVTHERIGTLIRHITERD